MKGRKPEIHALPGALDKPPPPPAWMPKFSPHGMKGNPLLRWAVGNLVFMEDANSNRRPHKAKSIDRIDPTGCRYGNLSTGGRGSRRRDEHARSTAGDIDVTVLRNFLSRNQITKSNPLPLVHTTESYFLKKILRSGEIDARPCNVFTGETLSYFFVGRAAYKKEMHQEAEYWELPACIVRSFTTKDAKRIFPFDSGAFAAKRYPSSINMMDLNDFETGADSEAPQKLIGTFFGNARNYFRLTARPREQFESMFDVDVLDEEVKALHGLIQQKSNRFDDRRFAIEVQFDNNISIVDEKPLCIILPETYFGK
jgi:hypothetical protein